MASVFLSYDREDSDRAGKLALALEKAGHSVWWDRHIKGGAQYGKEIEIALNEADAVVVLWSKRSVESAWVRDEAAAGRDNGRLVPVLIDGTDPPLGFRQYQSIDLSRWKGRTASRQFQELLRAVAALGGAPGPDPLVEERTLAPSRPRLGMLATAIAALIAVGGLLYWRPWEARSSMPVVAVAAATPSSSAQAMAQDLFVRLGSAQSGRIGSVQLVRDHSGAKPDLILEVSGTPSTANFALLRARDRQLIFSQQLVAPPGDTKQLKPSLDVATAAAVECAGNALASRIALPLDALKDFLRACVQFSSFYGTEEAYIPIGALEQVVQREPRFSPAWRQMLLAGAFMRSIPTENAKPSDGWLRAQIKKAKLVDARLPEIRLAELELLPMTDFTKRIGVLDELRAAHPDDKYVLGARAEQLMIVGRNTEAVETAERSARLHPLDPYSRSRYVRALAFSGRLERALEEMKRLEILDDVAQNLTETQFRVHLRYGDPRAGLRIFRKYGTNKPNEAILLARIEPTPAREQQAVNLARTLAVQRGFYSTFAETLLAYGHDDEVFETLLRVPRQGANSYLLQTLFRPTLSRLREKPRFLQIAQRYGLLEYWRKSGNWPDFCIEPDLPYDCKAEAAKLAA